MCLIFKKVDSLYKINFFIFLFDEGRGSDEKKRIEHRYVTLGGLHGFESIYGTAAFNVVCYLKGGHS